MSPARGPRVEPCCVIATDAAFAADLLLPRLNSHAAQWSRRRRRRRRPLPLHLPQCENRTLNTSPQPHTHTHLTADRYALSPFIADTIYDVLRARGWKEVDTETDWDVAWIDTGWLRENFDGMHLEEHQRINHFRNHYELTRKDNLIKNLKRCQRQLQREGKEEEARKYDFFPARTSSPRITVCLLRSSSPNRAPSGL